MTHAGRVALLALRLLCAATGGAVYRSARARDASRAFRGGLSLGVGFYAEVEATSALTPAIGFADATVTPRLSLKWDPSVPEPKGTLRTAAFPALLLGWPFYGYGETSEGYGDTSPYLRGFVAPWVLMGNHHIEGRTTGLFQLDHWIPNPRISPERYAFVDAEEEGELAPKASGFMTATHTPDSFSQRHGWFGVSATLLFVRVDLGFNPLEFLNFLGGLFQPD